MAAEAADKTNMGGQSIHGPTEGQPKIATASGETERVDIGGDVEACWRESLCAPGPGKRAGAKKTARTHDQGKLGGGSETACG